MTITRIVRLTTLALLVTLPVAALGEDASIRPFDLATTERLGRAMYDQDQLVWKASDVMTEQFSVEQLRADKVHGWVVSNVDGQDIVRFTHDGADGPEIYCEVRPTASGLSPCNKPQTATLSADDLVQYNARLTALTNVERPCSNRYNTVVLKDPERDDWLVWALAATTEPGAVVYGGHYRFTIAKDGKSVVQRDALSRNCMTMPPVNSSQGQPVMLAFMQLVSNTPVETAVFLNLQHKIAFEIITSDRKRWDIVGGHITLAGELPQ